MEEESKISASFSSTFIYVCIITNNVNQFNVEKQIPVQAVEMPGSMNDSLDVQVSALHYILHTFEPAITSTGGLIILAKLAQSMISELTYCK